MRWAAGRSKKLGATLRLVHAVPSIEAWPERQMDQEFESTLRDDARRTIQDLGKAADACARTRMGSFAPRRVLYLVSRTGYRR